MQQFMPNIFLINGPAGSGKDWLAGKLAEYSARERERNKVVKFAEPLKRAVAAIYHGGKRSEFDKLDTFDNKKLPQEVYFGLTCREVQIAVSEKFLKPLHGQKVFGTILANDIEQLMKEPLNCGANFFISDSGFRPEAEVLIDRFGARNVYLFRIQRAGYTFEGDSRSYIDLEDLGVDTYDLVNVEGNPSVMLNVASKIVKDVILSKKLV